MTSVLNGGGYNLSGNQYRRDIQNLTARLDTLTKGVTSLKDLFVGLHPEKADEVSAAFDAILNPPAPVPSAPVDTTPPAAQRLAAANRYRT